MSIYRSSYSVRRKNRKNRIIVLDEFQSKHGHEFVILSAAHNKSEYLIDWAQSIVYQNYKPISVVLMDDGSTDNTISQLSIVGNIFKKNGISYKFLKSFRRKHCASAYKKALEFSFKGEYFGILDADDMLAKEAVKSVIDLYVKFPTIAYIYTQFQICNAKMSPIKNGWCCAPEHGKSLLDFENKQHSFSHWRTFSNRLSNPSKLWQDGFKCAIDKYMGYRLEEMGNGMFYNKVCYLYRQSAKNSITGKEDTKATWRSVIQEAKRRRKKHNLIVFPIIEFSEEIQNNGK